MNAAAETIRVEHGDDHVDVTTRYRLWAAIPAEERITEEEIQEARYYSAYYGQKELDALRNPRCAVATKPQHHQNKWQPCRRPVATGNDLCVVHGGASAARKPEYLTRRQLEFEIARLREELDSRA